MPLALQCPRCNGSVSVDDDAAGMRVNCPHCEKPFLAPGAAAAANDDDDWLKLDDDPPIAAAAKPKPATSSTPQKPKNESLPFDDDDFTTEIETPPSSGGTSAPVNAPKTAESPAVAKPTEPKYATEYRVTCSICGSVTYAKASQAGKKIKCTDCHSPILVPPPPKVKPKVDLRAEDGESFQFEQNQLSERRPDPYTKSAAALLEEASREEVASGPHKYDDQPDLKEWCKNVFGIFVDPGVVMHWIALSVLASIPAYIALAAESAILNLGLIVGGAILGAVVVSCGFAILQSVANQEEQVSEWPVFDPIGWFSQLFVAVAAAVVAVVPMWMACSVVFGQSLISIAITMLSVYTLFPFVLLSMLDMESPFVPFSAEVARSVTKSQESWGGFYFSSGLLFIALFLFIASLATTSAPTAAVLSIIAVIGITFTYFAMIGRLAYAIGQAVNEPPMKNDIDRTRKKDVE